MDSKLAVEQTLRYATEFRRLYEEERGQRRAAEEALDRLADSYATTVRVLAAAVELRDHDTAGHAERVTQLALDLAERVAPELAADSQFEYGCLLHDIGKIGVPDGTLLKAGALDEGEARTMRAHPLLGGAIVERVPYLRGMALDVVASHHERWDGAGYPDGLAGEQIPLCARIFAVVDTFDAMTSNRPYRPALDVDTALREIERMAGSQFDPDVARAFVELVREGARAA